MILQSNPDPRPEPQREPDIPPGGGPGGGTVPANPWQPSVSDLRFAQHGRACGNYEPGAQFEAITLHVREWPRPVTLTADSAADLVAVLAELLGAEQSQQVRRPNLRAVPDAA